MTFRHVLRRRPVRERRPSQKGPSAFDRLLALSGPGFRQTYVCTHMHARTCALLSSLSLVIVLPTATVTHRRARVHASCMHRPCSSMDGWMAVSHARPPSPAQEDTACGHKPHAFRRRLVCVAVVPAAARAGAYTVRYSTRRGARPGSTTPTPACVNLLSLLYRYLHV